MVWPDPVHGGYSRLRKALYGSNLPYLLRRKLAASWFIAAFTNHIVGVVRGCTKEQVIGITAWTVIAFVAHLHSFRYLSVSHLPRHPMCAGIFTSNLAFAVAGFFVGGALPWPTLIHASELNPIPKTNLERRLFRPPDFATQNTSIVSVHHDMPIISMITQMVK